MEASPITENALVVLLNNEIVSQEKGFEEHPPNQATKEAHEQVAHFSFLRISETVKILRICRRILPKYKASEYSVIQVDELLGG